MKLTKINENTYQNTYGVIILRIEEEKGIGWSICINDNPKEYRSTLQLAREYAKELLLDIRKNVNELLKDEFNETD